VLTLSPSSISQLLYPQRCELRWWLKHHRPELEVDEFDAFQDFLRKDGERHETELFEKLKEDYPDWIDAGGRKDRKAREKTEEAIGEGKEMIYQGLLIQEGVAINGEVQTVLGYPDFLLKTERGYGIADAKLARSVYEVKNDGTQKIKRGKKYIELQVQLYGWLFGQQFPDLEFELVVLNGSEGREEVPYDDGEAALASLEELLRITATAEEPWEPVGWSKCSACGFSNYCWPKAEEEKATGLVLDLDQTVGRKLRSEKGIETYPQVLEEMSAVDIANLTNKTSGAKSEKTLNRAIRILENARALESGEEIVRKGGESELKALDDDYYVMFDLEGVPPNRESNERIYLWGLQVFGKEQGEFRPAFAHFGEGGDEQGWIDFLEISRQILDEHAGIRFVHWAAYEKTKIKQYMRRFPDSDLETAKEVKGQ
jgi:predicted RecB family nuclease